MIDIKDRLHNLMLRSNWQSRDDQETILFGVKEIEKLRTALKEIEAFSNGAFRGADGRHLREVCRAALDQG